MKLLLFVITLFLRRLWRRLRDAAVRSPALTIAVTALCLFLGITLFVYDIPIHSAFDWSVFVLLLAVSSLAQLCALWFNTESLNQVLLRFSNSRYTRQTIGRTYFLCQGMLCLVPPIFLLCLFLGDVLSIAGQLPAAPLPVLGLFIGFHFVSSLLFQTLGVRFSRAGALVCTILTSAAFLFALYLGSITISAVIAVLTAGIAAFFLLTLRAEYAIQKPVLGAKLFLPRIKGLLSDYVSANFMVVYILSLYASVFILYDFLKLLESERPEPQVIKNYAFVSLLLGSLSFIGAADSGNSINWKMQLFAGLRYRTYCIRSLTFLSLIYLPVWLPAFVAYCFWLPLSGVLLFPLVLGVNLLFTVHFFLLQPPPKILPQILIKGALWFAFILAGAWCYYSAALPGLLLALPLLGVCFKAREDLYDWGSYDYMR
ncbi:hypothetical protein FACS189444_4830 [Spirochaetia bacterium]|nr:hypothetical protein FACS189444_4830 [Spirochaetia bacterium]